MHAYVALLSVPPFWQHSPEYTPNVLEIGLTQMLFKEAGHSHWLLVPSHE